MSNEDNSNLNVILGQLEDELRAIKSAREQADDIVSANSELSSKLERVIVETRKLIKESNAQTLEAVRALSGEVGRISEQTDAIKKAATDSTEAITKQASAAQATLDKAASSVANTLSAETEGIMDRLRAMEESSRDIASVIQKQASDAQASLDQTADKAVSKASSQISKYTEHAISSLNEAIDKAKSEIVTASESLKTATSNVKAGSDALLEANEFAATENKHQNEETRALLNEAQSHLADIDASIATLKGIDIDSLVEEIKGLKTIETNNTTTLKSKLMIVTILASASVVICLATLVKLLV